MKPMHIRRALFASLLLALTATAAQSADLSISQFRVRGPAGGNDEFIELFNGGSQPLDLSGYKFNASNRNDILHRFMSGNQYVKETLHATLPPSDAWADKPMLNSSAAARVRNDVMARSFG